MVDKTDLVYEFGRFRLYAAQRILVHNGEPVALTPKGFDTLLALVESKGRTLEKEELMKTLWPGIFVEEGNLSQNIFLLRKVLGSAVGPAAGSGLRGRGFKGLPDRVQGPLQVG
jgi:DNA-binding winged helix-turn-helix (wHTH) protein